MKWAVAIFAIATLFYLATADTPSTESRECEPGQTWTEDCNNCVCTSTGLKACTLMACPPKEQCVPGTTWLEDCNTCICGTNGRKVCSMMECHKDIAKKSISHGECEPGQTWEEDCNNCVCTPNGIKACTLMACPPKD